MCSYFVNVFRFKFRILYLIPLISGKFKLKTLKVL